MNKEYVTSRNEMNRRKRAFATLEISLFLSVFLLSFDFIILFPKFSVACMIISAIIMFLLIIVVNRILNKQSFLRIFIFDKELIRKFKNASENYLLKNIESIRIKRTTRGLIREIKLNMIEEKAIFINGLDDFEIFKNDLIDVANIERIINYKEPIDYDHPLYYVFFGSLVGIISTLLFKLILLIGENNIILVQFLIACFLIITGVFWIFNKPIRSRYGNKNKIADYIFGLLILIIGIISIIYFIIY